MCIRCIKVRNVSVYIKVVYVCTTVSSPRASSHCKALNIIQTLKFFVRMWSKTLRPLPSKLGITIIFYWLNCDFKLHFPNLSDSKSLSLLKSCNWQLRAAAHAVGEGDLESKFAAASESLRRGIMFANSLYLWVSPPLSMASSFCITSFSFSSVD